MFHITFVQIGVFDWLSGRQKGSIFVKMFKNLLLRNHKEDEAETWHTCLYPHSTGRRFRYAHGDHGVSLKLFQIAAEA